MNNLTQCIFEISYEIEGKLAVILTLCMLSCVQPMIMRDSIMEYRVSQNMIRYYTTSVERLKYIFRPIWHPPTL